MIRRHHAEPFLREAGGRVTVDFLDDPGDGRVTRFLDRLCRLIRRLEGRRRSTVREALRRQERRIRDARRLEGVARTLTDLCRFRPPPGAHRAPDVRRALFEARGRRWPPTPGDRRAPYEDAARSLELEPDDVERLLYADAPDARILVRTPRLTGRELLARYNLDLARAVLLDADRVVVTATEGWRDIFRAVKLGRLMYRIDPAEGGGYRVELTGPAAPFVTRPRRYGPRFARVVPAVARTEGWRIEATVLRDGRTVRYALAPHPRLEGATRATFAAHDSKWEAELAREFEEKLGRERDGWTLEREDTPVQVEDELFLPDFTFRHEDGRSALVEIVGFWAPGYLEKKLRKVRKARLPNLVLVVYRDLAAGEPDRVESSGAAEVVWFAKRPLIGPVMEAVERAAV